MAETTQPAAAPAAESPKRYAAYDVTYLKFIGGVLDTKKAVADQAVVKETKDAGREVEIREV